jgi:D-alanyl-D-alanine carboxypeptidase
MRRPAHLLRLIVASLVVLALPTPRAAQAAPLEQSAGSAPPPLPASSPGPALETRAAVVIDAATGAVLFEQSAHERLPPASLTKMATALVAVERGDPGQRIVATANSMAEPTAIGLEPGDRLPLSEALYGMLLNSGNDAALAIAETLGDGSIARFVGWMNTLVASLGLVDTRFANPHGLDVGQHYSSAYDMALIGRALLRQPLLRSIVGTQHHEYNGPPVWAFHNINPFLTAYQGADGIKTGYETRAGHTLAASATRDGREVIAVVLNSQRYVADGAALLDYGFARLASMAATSTTDPTSGPRPGRVERLLASATGRPTIAAAERSYLRSALRPELRILDDDPGLLAGPSSVYERLRAAASMHGHQ